MLTHDCIDDNEWDVEIKCHLCGRKLDDKKTEFLFNYLKDTKW